ncbi:hypothetical protein SFRURICE_002568 [Spodoptera frugiperda]|nr:hypothetical protein SFRURICE_002568 [Spodoptera frugiperda]
MLFLLVINKHPLIIGTALRDVAKRFCIVNKRDKVRFDLFWQLALGYVGCKLGTDQRHQSPLAATIKRDQSDAETLFHLAFSILAVHHYIRLFMLQSHCVNYILQS